MKPIVKLIRLWTDEEGTFGTLVLPNGQMYFVVEPELKDNQSSVSCIPTGMYTVDYEPSAKYGSAYWVKSVAGRSYIKIHKGNTEEATEGCLVPGNDMGIYNGKRAVLNSDNAVKEIERQLNKESFTLIIRDSY